MNRPRDTYKYLFKIKGRTVHGGITPDLQHRERELRQTYGDDGHIEQVGRRTTEEAAREWEVKRGFCLPTAQVDVPMPKVKPPKPNKHTHRNHQD